MTMTMKVTECSIEVVKLAEIYKLDVEGTVMPEQLRAAFPQVCLYLDSILRNSCNGCKMALGKSPICVF